MNMSVAVFIDLENHIDCTERNIFTITCQLSGDISNVLVVVGGDRKCILEGCNSVGPKRCT